MPSLFYTLNYAQRYFVFAHHLHKSKDVQVEYLNQQFQIADEDEDESFKAYLVEIAGAFFDDNSRFLDNQTIALAPEELKPFLMIYIPLAQPALFVIDRTSHAGLIRLNFSHLEKYLPQVVEIFDHQIESEDLPDIKAHSIPHEVPEDWLER